MRSFVRLLASLSLCLVPSIVNAGWGPDGVTIRPTGEWIPLIAACSDGANGSIVAWQEEPWSGSGILRAQHVLATGDIDPTWPAEGIVVCSASEPRRRLGAFPDGLGGAYLWWLEGGIIYAIRIGADGQVPPQWPARGQVVGMGTAMHCPSVIADGTNGLWFAWNSNLYTVNLSKLGPDNTAASATIGGTVVAYQRWPQLALDGVGGVFVARARMYVDPEQPSGWAISHFDAALQRDLSWPSANNLVAPIDAELMDPSVDTPWVSVSDDGAGGAFMCIATPSSPEDPAFGAVRVLRFAADGSRAAGWPEEGVPTDGYRNPEAAGGGGDCCDYSIRVLDDGWGRAILGTPQFPNHGSPFTEYTLVNATGVGGWMGTAGPTGGHDLATNGAGGLYVASVDREGPQGPYDSGASLQLIGSDCGWLLYEVHGELFIRWYGDVAVAPTEDGGVTFFWSQVQDRYGLFGRRFRPCSQVTAVAPAPETSRSRAHFVRGVGIRLAPSPAAGTRVELYDVAGRRLASLAPGGFVGGASVVLPGTSSLPSGLYFVRVVSDGESTGARVVVTR